MRVATGSSGLVDIVREFLAVDLAVGGLLDQFRRGELRIEDVQQLVSDSEESPLFRLKERCHALFRPGPQRSRMARHREVLLDLAVGSLFHEAMKFRENFYQREVYGPRVRALRGEAGKQAESLFREFEKIEAGVSARLEEGLAETDALLARTREQVRMLLSEHAEDGHLARFLVENRERVEQIFAEGLDRLLEESHGAAAAGYAFAGRSYLTSGYYAEAEGALAEAAERGGSRAELEPDMAYARGMRAYLNGSYAEAVAQLEGWVRHAAKPPSGQVELAYTALAKLGDLVEGDDRELTLTAATALLERLARLRQGGASPAAVG